MSCDCEPGYYLCPEAVSLWNAVGRAFDQSKQSGSWDAYERAQVAYYDHLPQESNKS